MMTRTGVVGLEALRTMDCTLQGEPRGFDGGLATECVRERREADSKAFA